MSAISGDTVLSRPPVWPSAALSGVLPSASTTSAFAPCASKYSTTRVHPNFTALKLEPIPVPDTIPGLVSIVAERDLVVMSFVREGKDKEGKPYTTTSFDMFRVANGKIVEHWDIATKQ